MLLVLFAELFLLFLLSRFLTRELSLFFFVISKSKTFATYCMAIIFLPGTLIHELSHAIMAKILFVPVGKIELLPELHGESLKLGSVEVGRADFVRNFLIGIAPFLIGTTITVLLIWYGFTNDIIGVNWMTALLLYVLFVVSNTMYSSKKDLEGAIEFFVFVLLVVGFLYVVGIRPSNFGFLGDVISPSIIVQGVYFLLLPIGIDAVVILLALLLNRRK